MGIRTGTKIFNKGVNIAKFGFNLFKSSTYADSDKSDGEEDHDMQDSI